MKYKGPPKRFTMKESDELRTKAHAYSTDLQTGEVIIEEVPGYESAGKKDIIINDKNVAEITEPKPQTQSKEFEASVKKWKQYLKDNQGKIPNEFPTIFDKKNNATSTKNVQK